MAGVRTPNLEHQKRMLYPLHHAPPVFSNRYFVKSFNSVRQGTHRVGLPQRMFVWLINSLTATFFTHQNNPPPDFLYFINWNSLFHSIMLCISVFTDFSSLLCVRAWNHIHVFQLILVSIYLPNALPPNPMISTLCWMYVELGCSLLSGGEFWGKHNYQQKKTEIHTFFLKLRTHSNLV